MILISNLHYCDLILLIPSHLIWAYLCQKDKKRFNICIGQILQILYTVSKANKLIIVIKFFEDVSQNILVSHVYQ